MKRALGPGISREQSFCISGEMALEFIPWLNTRVISAPCMIALMEMVCSRILKDYLDDGEASVGTAVSIRRLGVTPPGMILTVKAKLAGVTGRRCVFDVCAYDEGETVGKGVHERFIIELKRFASRVTLGF